MKNDKVCPLLKSQCIREKCVCFYMRKTDTYGLGMEVEPYGTCSYFNINLDYVEEEED